MISVWFNKTSHHYLMWANRTDPAAGRLMIWRLFQKDLERSDGSEHTRVQIEHFVMKLRLVQSLEWKQNQLLQFEFVSERFHRQRREADDLYLLWSFWTQNGSPEQQDVWDVQECERTAESVCVIFYIFLILHDNDDQQTSVNASLCSSAGCRSAAALPRCL